MTSIHEQKTEVFKANQEVRKQELAALNKAIEIISSPNVADSYAGHVNLVQKPSFLQTQSTSQRVSAKNRAASLEKESPLPEFQDCVDSRNRDQCESFCQSC